MRPWFILSTLAFAGVHAQQSLVSDVPSSCSPICTVLDSLRSTDPATLCSEDVREKVQKCLSCILIIGGKAITPDLTTSSQAAADEFTKACENASFDLGPILVQTNPPATTTGKKNGVPRVAAVGVSGLAFVCGVTMLLL